MQRANPFDLPTDIADEAQLAKVAQHLKTRGVRLPTFGELADPATIDADIGTILDKVDPDQAAAANLFRVHWFNGSDRRSKADVPGYIEIPTALSGVPARIVLLIGRRFPMITAHKVLAAYACLVPRLVTGRFDPEGSRAVWPSTGNYCRGGVAISRILGCRGVAVLPEGMSQERFDWLQSWAGSEEDIIRTPGTESNVKEIYDKCAELERDPANDILNQFSEFSNYVGHAACTGPAIAAVFEHLNKAAGGTLALRGFSSATGSAGTIGAGDFLKEHFGTSIIAVEPTECPTLSDNGYGEHNIQGIGDKHVPLIHNVMNTDAVVTVSDRATDDLDLLFNEPAGRDYLVRRRGLSPELVAALPQLGYSAIANMLAAIRFARYRDLGETDLVMTVATDGADLYQSEHAKFLETSYGGTFDEISAGEVFGRHLLSDTTGGLLDLSHRDRRRIFNLGYYTWVEQQGIELADFNRRLDQAFWKSLRGLTETWDALITDMNNRTGVNAPRSSAV